MTLDNYLFNEIKSLYKTPYRTTNQFLTQFSFLDSKTVFSGEPFDLELSSHIHRKKIPPIIELATPNNAHELTKIYRDLFFGTYPYREMLDENQVKTMITNPSIQWIVFRIPSGQIVGCITFMLDFFHKRGYIRGFMLKRKYQGHIDIVKAMIGSMIGMCCSFKDKILSWYVENRTAHTSSQYPMYRCGIEPIGFYPNKDIFLGKVESDLMQIAYDVKSLNGLRSHTRPQIIPEAERCFTYANKRYNLGLVNIKRPILKLNKNNIISFKGKLTRKVVADQFDYHYITLYIPGTESYFQFLYTPHVQNFEKTEYVVNSLEELYVFVQEFKRLASLLKVRYCEAFISAYQVAHQALFSQAGLNPRGYVPSWKFNQETHKLEDHILFNWFQGPISKDIRLIKEARRFLEYLRLYA